MRTLRYHWDLPHGPDAPPSFKRIPCFILSCLSVVLLSGTIFWRPLGLHHQSLHPQVMKLVLMQNGDYTRTWVGGRRLSQADRFWCVLCLSFHKKQLYLLYLRNHKVSLCWFPVRAFGSSGWTGPDGPMMTGCQAREVEDCVEVLALGTIIGLYIPFTPSFSLYFLSSLLSFFLLSFLILFSSFFSLYFKTWRCFDMCLFQSDFMNV